MNIYTFTFFGRLVGSIGGTHHDVVEVVANTEAEAISRLYETHEHISRLHTTCFPATYDSEGRTSLRMCREAREAASRTGQHGG